MQRLTRRTLIASLAALPLAPALHGAPTSYTLQASRSTVGFTYRLSGTAVSGSMPIKSATVLLDMTSLTRSSIDVSVDVSRAKAGLIFATEALKAPSVLDARHHPTIRFRSTLVRLNGQGRLSDGAKIDGLLTLKGTTRPVTFDAALFRQSGTRTGDFSHLSFQLKGRISRAAFGANGYAGLVHDEIGLNIIARVTRG